MTKNPKHRRNWSLCCVLFHVSYSINSHPLFALIRSSMLEKLFGTKQLTLGGFDSSDVAASLDRYDRIFKGSRGYGFIDWDMNTGRVYWQGGFWEHLGYREEEINKVSRAERFLKFIHPEDRNDYYQNVVDLLKNRERKDLICRVVRRDGSYVWAEMRLDAVRNESGWVSHLSGVAFDISTLKETEQALMVTEARHARIIEASNDGIWEWSAAHGGKRMKRSGEDGWEWSHLEGGFTFSARCWEMLGYVEEDGVVQGGLVSWRSLMHKDDGERFDKMLIAHITQRTPFDIEYRIRGKDGDWRWIRGRGLMSYDPDGRPSMLSGTNMDITQLKRAEERVVRAKEEAEKASQAKSEFLSSMSHELRTPLNAILGFAQLFELDNTLTREQRENVLEIKSAGKHLLELVGDVLDLAKIEAGRLKLSLERVLPSRVINECAALLKSQMDRRELSLDIHYNELDTQAILADPIRLKQVFLNLMGNAAKYNKKGGKVIVSCSMDNSGRMRMVVEDNGVGIPKHLQAELFQPFNRLGAERSGIEGSGVGLVITKQLVQQMGGEIGFKSEERLGSQFWVEFPIAQADVMGEVNFDQVDLNKVIIEDNIPELLVSEKKSVLYVEDNPSNQKLLKQVLAKFSMLDLTVVGLAVQGLFVARSTLPDLVILDVNLPGIDGYEIVEILKQDPATKHIPVIALSANVLSHDIKKGKDAGFDFYLTKPLNLGQLVTVCNQLLA